MNPLRILFSLALCCASFACAQEGRRELGPGRAATDQKILTPGQQDRWEVAAEADEVLRFRVSSQQFDPVLELHDAAGEVLARDDGRGSQSYVQFRVERAQPVAFVVRGYRGGGGGAYDVWFERYRTTAAAVGDVVTGTFPDRGWAHVRLQLESGERFAPVATEGRLSYVMHFGPDHQLHPTLSVYTALAAGEHHLRLEGAPGRPFAVRILRPTNRAPTLDQPLQVTLAPHATDILRLALPADRAVMFDLAMPRVQLQQHLQPLDLRRPYAMLGSADKGGRLRRLYWSRQGSELERWLHNPSGDEARYTFVPRPLDRPAPTGDEVGVLPLGDLVCHTIPARTGEIVSVAVRSESFDPGLVCIDPAGAQLAHVDDRDPLDRAAGTTFAARLDGVYRVLVYAPAYAGSGPYDFEVTRHEVPELACGRSLQLPCAPGADGHASLRVAAGQE
ncbi:MAG: hypothetical protein KAI24_13640, partial [Planctomycetes bacterium]|nr:hypothetical protein [Planctomycetota bacterium]